MVQYVRSPEIQLTIGGTVYSNITATAEVTRIENGFDTATVDISDYKSQNYPTITAGATVIIDVKDHADASWTTLLTGIIRFCEIIHTPQEMLRLKCDGAGYGLGESLVSAEYGSESSAGTGYDTLKEILGDGTSDNGIIHKWVNHLLGDLAAASGYAYTTTNVATITGTIKYLLFPYKPANKCLDDICEIVTAIKAGGAGPHWLVDTSSNLFVQLLDGTSANWPLYYGGSSTTLTYGTDFQQCRFEKLASEANFILYSGAWCRPSNRDWCENNSGSFSSNIIGLTDSCTITDEQNHSSLLSADADSGQKVVNVNDGSVFAVNDKVIMSESAGGNEENVIDSINVNQLTMLNNLTVTYHTANGAKVTEDSVKIGTYGIKTYSTTNGAGVNAYYPSSKDLSLNITAACSKNTSPTLDFWVRVDKGVIVSGNMRLSLSKWTDSSHYGYFHRSIHNVASAIDKWYHVSLPVGPYYKMSPVWDSVEWETGFYGANFGDWSDIDLINFEFYTNTGQRGRIWIDGLSFNGRIIRAARQSAAYTSTNPVKMKLITDDVGKDDTLLASDDSGTLARLAYGEYLRCSSTPTVGIIATPMIKDLLPGERFHIHAKPDSAGTYQIDADMRVTKLIHRIDKKALTEQTLTTDLTNTHPRGLYEDLNRVLADVRPNFQDRQASSIKIGDLDIELPVLTKSY